MRNALLVAAGVVSFLGVSCIQAPPVHPRAHENNELCASYIAQNDLTKAEVHCDLALQFSPQFADIWVNKGIIAYKRGQTDVAKEDFIKALRFNQEQAQGYNNLGYIYLQEKSYGRAHDNFQRALKVNPDYTEARYNLALTYLRMEDYEKAKKEYRTIIAINPQLADPWHDMGIIFIQEHQYEQAIEHLQHAVQLDASFADAWLNLGIAFGELARYQEAYEAYNACLEAEPGNVACRNNIAIVHRKGALQDAALTHAADMAPEEETPAAYFQLGMRYREKGLRREEMDAFRACLKLDGRYPACHFALFEAYRAERRDNDAKVGCKNFLKFAAQDEFPDEYRTCEQYLSSDTY
jgi:tetratricopeptide (TPR) repeat protein